MFQIELLSREEKPVFSNLVEQDSGLVTAGNSLGNPPAGGRVPGKGVFQTDLFQPVYDIRSIQTLLERAVEEYNKTHPRIKLAPYKVLGLSAFPV